MVIQGIEKHFIGNEKGYGLFTNIFIPQGDLVLKDEGKVFTKEEYFSLSPQFREWGYQVDSEHILMPYDCENPSEEWYVNHSCEPNTILRENGMWFARRNINAGDEITADYGLFWTNDFEDFEIDPCKCGAFNCRGRMTGNDWMIPQFQEKYKLEMPLYIQRKINL